MIKILIYYYYYLVVILLFNGYRYIYVMKIKYINITLVIITFLLLSGCVKVEGFQSINEDGFSEVELVFDISEMMAMSQQMGGSTEDSEDPCEEYDKNHSKTKAEEEFSMTCTYDDKGIVTLSGSKQLTEDDNLIVEKSLFKTIYTYNPKDILEAQMNLLNDDEGDMSSDDILEQGEQYGVELTYNLEMPGIIIEDDGLGDVVGDNRIEYDLFEVDLESDEFRIVSEVENKNMMYLIYGGAGLVGLIVLIIIFSIVIKIMKKKSSHVQSGNSINNSATAQSFGTGISRNEQLAKNYIEQYKNSYPKEAIKQGLINANIPENEIDTYLIKYF